MKKRLLLLLAIAMYVFSGAYAQEQGVQWKKFIGNDRGQGFERMIPAVDGGYLLVGYQDPSAPNSYQTDLLLTKVTSLGAVEWQKTYGGSKEEWGSSVVTTADGSYLILAGTCSYENDGDVTGHHGLDTTVPMHYEDEHPQDVWVLKINAAGNLQWAKTYGGSRYDEAYQIIKTNDGNYMITGRTSSWDGDLTGNRRSTEGPTGLDNADIWVFKINDAGSLLWQKCFGGKYHDAGIGIVEKPNGFLVTGWTLSNDQDMTGLLHNAPDRYTDAFVLDFDQNGTINWVKTYGGAKSDNGGRIIPYNSGYMIGASTASVNGDVVGSHQAPNNEYISDMWVFTIDVNGNLTWQLPLGTTDNDNLKDLIKLPDNSVVLLGTNTYNSRDHMKPIVTKLSNGNIVYDRVLDYMKGTYFDAICAIDNHNYVICGNVYKRIYNIPEEHINGEVDALFLKYGDVNTITGKVFIDNNGNNTYDAGEVLVNNVRVVSTKSANQQAGSVTTNGVYSQSVDTGSYTTSASIDNPNYTIGPVSVPSTFATYFDTATIDFAMTIIPGRNDLQAVLLPLSPARPGFQTQYWVKVSNKGTTTQQATVKLVKDARLTFVTATPAATVVNDTISWAIANFEPFKDSTFFITMQAAVPPTLNNGDTLKLQVTALPVTGDLFPSDNSDTLRQLVTGSYDPNDKTETHGGVITPEQISGADPLTYIIRFQNTGTDTAFNITVRDTLDSRLNWNSLQMIAASHAYQLSIEDGNKLTWQFNNIKLPYTGINEPASHGYIAYRIKPNTNVPVGDTIKNTAGIYFDYNLPIITNTEKTVVFIQAVLPVTLNKFNAMLKEDGVQVTWSTSMEDQLKQYEVQRSGNGRDFVTIGIVQPGNSAYLFFDAQPLDGYNYYRLRSVDMDGAATYSTVAMVNVRNEETIISSLYPNPATGNATLKLKGAVEGSVLVQVIDQQGRPVTTRQFGVQRTTEFQAPLNLGKLAKGSYILRITLNNKTYTHKLLIQ